MTMLFLGGDNSGWNAGHYDVRRDIAGHDSTGADNGALADRNPAQDRRI
jgi:hypothetical protein